MPDPRSTSHGGEGPRVEYERLELLSPEQRGYERLFPDLQPLAVPRSVFLRLGARKLDGNNDPTEDQSASDGPMVDPDENLPTWNSGSPPEDQEDNEAIPAGYTYLAQFIDHDLTLDFTSDPNQTNQISELPNARTPAFDLDCIYGLGPEAHPHLYEGDNTLSLSDSSDGKKDLLRLPEKDGRVVAIIGDPRNDENVLVAQVQLALISLHNRFMRDLGQQGVLQGLEIWEQRSKQKEHFDEARKLTRWHYQWVVLNDFLRRVVGDEQVDDVLANGPAFYKGERLNGLPVEFSGAAYRFGHSQVRPEYVIKEDPNPVPLSLFKDDGNDLRGSRKIDASNRVDWRRFFDFDSNDPQPTRRIDTKLSAALFRMFPGPPGGSSDVPPSERLLAFRNLRRGVALGLPSGEAVAEYMKKELQRQERPDFGIQEKLEDTQLGDQRYRPIRGRGETPLWYWLLAEARANEQAQGKRLGPVGGRIVAEVFIGLLYSDPESFLRRDPGWGPREDLQLNGKFDMPALLKTAGVADFS